MTVLAHGPQRREQGDDDEPSCLAVVDITTLVLNHPPRPGDTIHVELVGDLDVATGTTARTALLRCLARADRRLVLDLGRTFVDVRGAEVLAEVVRAAGVRGVDVEMRGAKAPLRTVLDVGVPARERAQAG